MNVVLAEKAIGDLIRIGRFIGQGDPSRAKSFVSELERCCEELQGFPQRYPLVPGHEAEGIRRRPHRNYLIFYRINEMASLVEVLHVLHGSQDYEAIVYPTE